MDWHRNASYQGLQRASHKVLGNSFVHDMEPVMPNGSDLQRWDGPKGCPCSLGYVTQEVAMAVPHPAPGSVWERSRNVSQGGRAPKAEAFPAVVQVYPLLKIVQASLP